MPPRRDTLEANKRRAKTILARLRKQYPDVECSLDYESPLHLLIATILAAQCTDARVNVVTKTLFQKYRCAQDYVDAPQAELEGYIKSCGFYRNKAKNIKKACASIIDKFGGAVPGTMEELLTLGGVGRKTANVVLGDCFNTPGVTVDTHCGRLARRLGFTKNVDPAKVEQDLMKVWPRKDWTIFSHCMVFHGRAICTARAPKCSACPLADCCPFPTTREGKKIAK